MREEAGIWIPANIQAINAIEAAYSGARLTYRSVDVGLIGDGMFVSDGMNYEVEEISSALQGAILQSSSLRPVWLQPLRL